MGPFKEVYSLLSEEADKDYLDHYKEEITRIFSKKEFNNLLKMNLLNNKYDAMSILELFYPVYSKYWHKPKEDILKYMFDWVLHLSFPEKVNRKFNKHLNPLVFFYLNTLRIFSQIEEKYNKESFQHHYSLEFLTKEEEKDVTKEYFVFKKAFLENWIYEMMKIDLSLTGHNTLEHILGVNYISLYIGRQIKKLGLPIDLGIVVGSALGHDIGKYGVMEEEINRVPYLHYYYTEKWFEKFNLKKIGHIATNHSTWDLELENLPLESLILIYSDFRVKNKDNKMHIFTLDEAYNIILNKLDNVDMNKELRYRKVYHKLKDFEDYIINLGVDTTLTAQHHKREKQKPFSLLNEREIINNIKFLAIDHNIKLMAKLFDDESFNKILEMARTEYNWKIVRLYLQIFKEYSTYLTQNQKILVLNYLTDLLLHREDDIRKEASELIGLLISKYDEEYRKEVPKSAKVIEPKLTSEMLLDKIIRSILYPDHKLIDFAIEWQYNLQNIINSLFTNCRSEHCEKYSKVLIRYYENFKSMSITSQFYLCQTVNYIPLECLSTSELNAILKYIMLQLDSISIEIRLATLDIINRIGHRLIKNESFKNAMEKWITNNVRASENVPENYLKYQIAVKFHIDENIVKLLKDNYEKDKENISVIFLQNLKTATEWMNKKINIDILYDQVKKSPNSNGFHIGMHFCNLLKVSAFEKVRNYAGFTLLNIFKFLSLEERNDIVVELLRALEMQSYQFTKFIPNYLGQLLLYLHPIELDEVIDDFEDKIKQSNTQVVFLLLKTISVAIENYPEYIKRFKEDKKTNRNRLIRLLSLILNGMVSFDYEIKIEAFRVLAWDIFNSSKLNLHQRLDIFKYISKKILTLLDEMEDDEFILLINSASLNHIYRFISDYEFQYGEFSLETNNKIAFFPGSFDPFSLSHKEIALEIRNLGFEVYLAVDEFSWSKRVQPHKFRKNIISMTIGHEIDIYLFPSEIPINIANDKDLLKLKSIFEGKEVYIVVGTDVLINASAYKKDGLLKEFSHIIFDRKSLESKHDDISIVEERIKEIKGKVLRLSLPPQYEDISSSHIRRAIDLNMDISNEMDPLAQQYIYKYGLYLNEPRYKSLIQTKTIEIEIFNKLDEKIVNYICNNFKSEINRELLLKLKEKNDLNILLLQDAAKNKLLGFSIFYWVKNSMLYDEFKDTTITNYIRENLRGRIVVIAGLFVKDRDNYLSEIVLNETLAHCVESEYNHAIYLNYLSYEENRHIIENIILQGFVEAPFYCNNNKVYIVDMSKPITLSQDFETLLKPPFDHNKNILSIIDKTRNRLKRAIANLYPGELVLVFNRDMIYSKLIQIICDINRVPIVQEKKRILGPNMCVPFGAILNGRILPNTVTKSMHTEKIFSPNIRDFTIGASPNYLSLDDQAKMLASFNRPIILVDDLLHKGYRLNVIEPILRNNDIKIKKLVVGILTGRGKEIGHAKNIDVDTAYFIPNLKLWFNESAQYPFIGGDAVLREDYNQDYIIPSINLILPYVFPNFIKNTSAKNIYEFSEICLINTIEIFKEIQKSYQEIHGKSLIIRNLGQIFISPRRPDSSIYADSIRNLKPTDYLEKDLENLKRIENLVLR
ncbi:MAG: cytidyltransferase [Tissierellia bacterium]|nr:cytidyltransferase [Tissierellia bacterium]